MPSPPAKQISWVRRHRRLAIIGSSLLAALVILVAAGVYYVRSGRLNRLIAEQIKQALADYGIRAEIGGFDLAFGARTARINNLKLYNQSTGELIASLDSGEVVVETPDLYALHLHRQIILKTVNLSNLQAYAGIDANGKPSWQGLHSPPPSGPSRVTFDFANLVGTINGGAIHVDDRQQKIAGELKGLKATARPASGEVAGLQFSADSGTFVYQGRATDIQGLDLIGQIGQTGARINRFILRSGIGNVNVNGKVDDWSALRYNLNLQAHAMLDEISRVLLPDTQVGGVAEFIGNVHGQGETFTASGGVKSDTLRAAGSTIHGAGIENLTIESDGKLLRFGGKLVRVNDAASQGVKLTGITAGGLAGEIAGGRTTAQLPELKVQRVETSGDRVDTVRLQAVKASVDSDKYQVNANLSIGGAAVSNATLGPASAKLEAKNGQVALNNLQASLFGGSAKGNALLSTRKGGRSQLTADFSQLNTADLLELAGSSNPPVAGTVGGHAAISWPGTDFKSVSGNLAAQLTAQTTQTKSAIPVNGDVAIKADAGNFHVDNLRLTTGNTSVSASGTLTAKGDSTLQFSVTSTKADELQTIAYSIDDIEKDLKDYQPSLTGGFSFRGKVTGQISDPAIEGDLRADSVGLKKETLGSLTGHFLFSPTEVAFENGNLAAADGGSAKVSYNAPRSEISTSGRLDAIVDRINIDTVLSALGITPKSSTISGQLTGEAHLTKLPQSPTGTATINLVNANVFGQPAQSATASVVLDGNTATLKNTDLKLAQGQVVAAGSYDLKSNAFTVQGTASNVDLAKMAESFDLKQVTTTGTLNANFSAKGNTEHISDLNVDLSAKGQDVMINGREAGVLDLTAKTSPGGRVDVNLVTGFVGRPQTVAASIELQQPGRPIEVNSDFSNLDLDPVLKDFAPDVESYLKATIAGNLRVGGPIVDANDDFTTDRLRGSLTLTSIASKFQDRDVNIKTPLVVSLAGKEVALNETHIGGQGLDLNLGGKIGLAEGAGMGFSLTGSADLNELSHLGPDLELGGKVALNVQMNGTFDDPHLTGDVTAENLAFSGTTLPVQISNGNGRIVLAGDKVTLEKFTALANDGNLTASGSFGLSKFKAQDFNFIATAKNIDVYYLGAEATVNSDLTLRGPSDNLVLGGTVNIPSGEYATNFNLNNLTAGGGGSVSFGGGEGGSSSSALSSVKLDVSLTAPGTLLVRNEQINTVATANLNLGGTLGDPSVTGRVALEGGTIKFQTGRYDIVHGTLDFPAGNGTPEVNLIAEGDVSGYHLTVGLSGPITDMDPTFRSDPNLQRSEILSLIATGKVDSNSIGSQGLVQSGLGTVGSLLSESFFSKPAESLLGLNRFALDPVLQPNANPAARLTIGKQLTRSFSFTYSTNLSSQQDQNVLLDYTLTNRFSALLSYKQGGSVINGASTDTAFSFQMRMRKRFSLGYGQKIFSAASTLAVVRRKLPQPRVTIENATGVKIGSAKRRELLPIETEGFNRALARLGEQNLENYLQEQGYFRATVKQRCDPADCSGTNPHVVYAVNLGNRYDLDDIRIEGTDIIDASDVSGELESRQASFVGSIPGLRDLPLIGGLARGITSRDRVLHDREAIRTHLVNMGYRSAHVDSHFQPGNDPQDIVLVFKVDPGPLSTVSKITFTGNSALPVSQLREDVPLKDGARFSPEKLRDGQQAIRSAYGNDGYLETTVQYKINDVSRNVVAVEYDVDEGVQSRVAEIDVQGQTKTHEGSIRRFIAFKKGDVLTQSKIRDTQRALFATGAFSEVNIRNEQIDASNPQARKVTVQISEIKPLLFVYGPGYSTDNGAEGLAELTNTNFLGRANSASIRLRISQREQLAQIQYTDLRPFGSQWALTFSTFYDRSTNLHTLVQRNLVGGGTTSSTSGPAFGIDRFSTFLQTERKVARQTSIHFRYNFENVKLLNPQNIPVEEIARNEQSIKLGMLSAGLTWDTRDSGVNPTTGQLVSAEHSVAVKQLGGTVAFNRFFLNYQRYRTLPETTPLLKDSVLAFSARIGLASPFQIKGSGPGGTLTLADMQLPISERFFAGGATTLRGFGYDQAGPQAILEPRNATELPTLVPVGGDAMMVYNFELRYPLTKSLRLVPFYDLGNVFPRIQDINWAGMTNSVGLGLRINTPLGPVGVDYGYLIDPPSFLSVTGIRLNQPHWAFHFRFGQTF